MNPLSQTRSARELTHLLQTPDTFVRAPLPTITGGVAIVHAAPALGAGFLQYTVELEPGGTLAASRHQRFLYVLAGTGTLELFRDEFLRMAVATHQLWPGFYAYLPPEGDDLLTAESAMRVVVIEKKYQGLTHGGALPRVFTGHEEQVEASALNGDEKLMVRSLLPADFTFDFAVNTMTYAPGAALSQVEVHVMEHGLLMLEGAGPYRLGDKFYDVQAGDFIWMAPFCPQWFEASAAGPAKYLIYKDWNRVPEL